MLINCAIIVYAIDGFFSNFPWLRVVIGVFVKVIWFSEIVIGFDWVIMQVFAWVISFGFVLVW